jgi:hypothetical protein
MPLTPVGLAAVLVPALVSSGQLGIAVPQFALGVATGVTLFAQASPVTSIDTGTAGAGVTAIPLIVPQPLLLSSLLAGFASTATVGVMAPALALGLANGLALGFLQGLITMTHPGVGVGAGVAKVIPASAVPSMIAGFAAAAMIGPAAVKLATGIGIALTITFGTYVQPIPILGAPSVVPATGVGIGKII